MIALGNNHYWFTLAGIQLIGSFCLKVILYDCVHPSL